MLQHREDIDDLILQLLQHRLAIDDYSPLVLSPVGNLIVGLVCPYVHTSICPDLYLSDLDRVRQHYDTGEHQQGGGRGELTPRH